MVQDILVKFRKFQCLCYPLLEVRPSMFCHISITANEEFRLNHVKYLQQPGAPHVCCNAGF